MPEDKAPYQPPRRRLHSVTIEPLDRTIIVEWAQEREDGWDRHSYETTRDPPARFAAALYAFLTAYIGTMEYDKALLELQSEVLAFATGVAWKE